MPSWLSLGFQDSGSLAVIELFCLHDYIMVVMISVLVFIMYMLFFIIFSGKSYKFLMEGTMIETVWSIIPALLLMLLVVPSMKVLYIMEDTKSPAITLKVVAHQWYWNYIVPFLHNSFFSTSNYNYDHFSFNSMMSTDESLQYAPRLLGCTDDLFIPINCTVRFIISSADVIHSFAVPSLGLKVDALPGRTNQLYLSSCRIGSYFGQCSEICGTNHSFMPIRVNAVSSEHYTLVSYFYLLSSIENNTQIDEPIEYMSL